MRPEPPELTERFLAAVALAQEVHGHVRRTGTEIPYLAHLLAATALAVEDGGDGDQAIAAMLHDAVEDGGGRPMLDRIHEQFGDRVATIVEGCSDSVEVNSDESWIERKRRYLSHLRDVDDEGILRVALADRVHNARSLVRDYREEGHALWERFTQKAAREQLWYHGGLLTFFHVRRPGPLTEDLQRAVAELAWLVACDHAQRHSPLRLWVDPDRHARQAPDGWAQVRTAGEAIQLLDRYGLLTISFPGPAEASRVIHWLIEQDTEGWDRWPTRRLMFHGTGGGRATDELIRAIEDHCRSTRHVTHPNSWGCADEGARSQARSWQGVPASRPGGSAGRNLGTPASGAAACDAVPG